MKSNYVRPTTTKETFFRIHNNICTLFTLKCDLHNRRVTSVVQRFGGKARTTVETFKTRDEARIRYEEILERREIRNYKPLVA